MKNLIPAALVLSITGILVFHVFVSVNTGQEKLKPAVYHVIIHSPGPQWVKSLSFREQPGIEAHINYMSSLSEGKKLWEGGPFLDNSGGMAVCIGTKEEVEIMASDDPAVKAGLLRFTIKPWLVAMSQK